MKRDDLSDVIGGLMLLLVISTVAVMLVLFGWYIGHGSIFH